MIIQMTREQYQAKYGTPPPVGGGITTPTPTPTSSEPIKMTRAEYQAKYGNPPPTPTGNQFQDTGLDKETAIAKLGLSNNPVVKGIKSVTDIFVKGLIDYTTEVTNNFASPEHLQQYSDAVKQHTDITTNLIKIIDQKKKMGQDTSKLEAALQEQNTSKPQLSDFLDPETVQRIQESLGSSVQEAIGNSVSAGVDLSMILPMGLLEKGATAAEEKGVSLGSKIWKGVKAGGQFGLLAGFGSGMANKESPIDVAKSTALSGVGGAAIGAAAEGVGGAILNKLQGEPASGNITKVPEKLTGEKGALLNVPEARSIITDTHQQIKDAVVNPGLPSPNKVGGSQDIDKILSIADTQRKAIGEQMGKILDTPGVGDQVLDTSARQKEFTDFIKKTKLNTKFSGDKFGDGKIYNNFVNDISNLNEKVGGSKGSSNFDIKNYQAPTLQGKTLKAIDEGFLRIWQPQLEDIQDPTLHKAISNFVEGVNEDAKNLADTAEEKVGIKGKQYRTSNEEYKQILQNINGVKKEAGVKNIKSGIYKNADKVVKDSSNPNTISEEVRNLSNQTGVNLPQNSMLRDLVTKINNKEDISNELQSARIGMSPWTTILRNIQSFALKNRNNPDLIVEKMLKLIDESNKGK